VSNSLAESLRRTIEELSALYHNANLGPVVNPALANVIQALSVCADIADSHKTRSPTQGLRLELGCERACRDHGNIYRLQTKYTQYAADPHQSTPEEEAQAEVDGAYINRLIAEDQEQYGPTLQELLRVDSSSTYGAVPSCCGASLIGETHTQPCLLPKGHFGAHQNKVDAWVDEY
jgi:hypothetical protein